MRARGDEEGVDVGVGGGGFRGGRRGIGFVAYVGLCAETVVDDSVGEEEEVRCEGGGPGAGYCCCDIRLAWKSLKMRKEIMNELF